MATFSTYDQVGLAEDVSDVITDISPTDTPMVTLIRPQKVSARVYEYQTDTLPPQPITRPSKVQMRRWQLSLPRP